MAQQPQQPKLPVADPDSTDSEPETFLSSKDIKGVAEFILSDRCKKIAIFAGAGISVSAGIPDFRSKDGFYQTLNLDKYQLTASQKRIIAENPEYILTIHLFKENPIPYLQARRDFILAPDKYNPTVCHWLFRLFHEKKLLKRFYSTNIDGLDALTGFPDELLVNVHGTVSKAECHRCGKYADMEWFRAQLRSDRFPENAPIMCQHCPPLKEINKADNPPYIKPSSVLFGEGLPKRYFKLVKQERDLSDVDLMIVAGSSLLVQPSASLPSYVSPQCIRVFINRDPPPMSEWSHLQNFRNDSRLYACNDPLSRDVFLKGDCDNIATQLIDALHWRNELQSLIETYNAQKTKRLAAQQSNAENDPQTEFKTDN